ncbi:MAG: acyl-CoA dehydrogenase family protein, partial [Longimicrobiales bacterium]
MARDFAAGEIRPHSPEWDAARELDRGVFEKLAELGFMGMRVPEEYGGLGFDASTYLLALEQLAWGDAAVALSVAIHNGPVTALLLEHGTDAQRERYLPAMAAGDVLTAFALSEKGAGSDAGGLGCQAVKDGDGWVLSGEKRWVTNGASAGLVLVLARTDPSAGSAHGIGVFIVEPSTNGYSVTGRETTMGLCASETVSVHL